MDSSILEQILQVKDVLPKKQRILCNYIALNYSKVAMMTVAELASNAEVGTTTVMRLMQVLKCDSYNSFKRDLMSDTIVRDSSAYADMKHSISTSSQNAGSPLSIVIRDLGYITSSLQTPKNLEQFEQIIQLFLSGETIYTLGFRSSTAVIQYFQDSVHLFFQKVQPLSTAQEFLFDNLLHMTPADVLFVVSEWPCTKKTVVFAEMCHKQGIPIALITNTSVNPIARFANAVINTNSVGEKTGRLPSMLVIEALVQELGRRTNPRSIEMISQLENMLKEDGIVVWENGY